MIFRMFPSGISMAFRTFPFDILIIFPPSGKASHADTHTPDNGLVDSIQDRPDAPAPKGRQPVVPADGHYHTRDAPFL